MMWAATVGGQAVLLYLGASFVSDLIHGFLHLAERSSFGLLRAIGALHKTHHEFLNADLRFDDRLVVRNLIHHRLGEFGSQLCGIALGLLIFEPAAVVIVAALCGFQFLWVTAQKGKDSNHIAFDVVPSPLGGLFVGPAYHALHHRFPGRYLGSVTTLVDRLFGTGCAVAGRKVAMTGASGAFGAPLKEILERAGAQVRTLRHGEDFGPGDTDRCAAALADADLLVLAHGSKLEGAMEANCDSFVALIERFRKESTGRKWPPEIWAVGSEIECHPAWGNADLKIYKASKEAYARHARAYYWDRGLLYRHIVPSSFRSKMGPGLISGRAAAAWAWFLIRRGFRYVPVTYTGIALLNYAKFFVAARATAPGR